jgi:hypothetical protein
MLPYFTVLIPAVPLAYATEWHCTDTTGPWAHAILSRGAFATVDAAIDWARAHLNGAPYTVKRCNPAEDLADSETWPERQIIDCPLP